MLLDLRPHPLHPRLSLFRWHFESRPYGARQLFGVVGIDRQSVHQFMACSREAAQNQRSLLIVPRGYVLLGHQIHPVVKGRDQAKIGRAIIWLDLFVAVMPIQEYDRLPSTRAETAVDAIHFLLYFRRQILITLDVRPAGRADLN